jgi:hypothetical protein
VKSILVAGLVALSLGAMAQTAPPVTDDAATKPVAKKPLAKKAPPKKAPAKKQEAAKKPAAAPTVTVYKNDPNAPIVRDKQGNIIPTNPEAYDVSSAVGKKK